MGKLRRHNWIKYKEDYFNSDIDDVTHFFSAYDASISRNTFRPRTIGWRDEKLEHRQRLSRKAIDKIVENQDVTELTLQLLKAKNNIIKKVASLCEEEEFEKGDLRDVKLAWEILKTELGEPSKISDSNQKIDFKERPVFKQVQVKL